MGALLGDIDRREVAVLRGQRQAGHHARAEVENLPKLLAQTGARAVKFRVGGRMSRNVDASPGRTEKLIPLARKTLGETIDVHDDANSSYDAAAGAPGGPAAARR